MKSNGITLVLAMLALAAAPSVVTAQNTFPASGNVAIGTTNPQAPLDLGSGTAGRSLVWGGSSGTGWYASIGTSYSSSSLGLLKNLKFNATVDQYLYSYTGTVPASGIRFDSPSGDIFFFNQSPTAVTAGGVFNWQAETNLTIKASGNVGIGTILPVASVDARATTALDLVYNQNFGPLYLQNISAGNGIGNYGGSVVFSGSTEGNIKAAIIAAVQTGSDPNQTGLSFITQGSASGSTALTEKMRLTHDGKLGIGTTNPTYPLSVNGTIEAQEVIVQTGWSDYVFAPAYRLAPLSEVEQQIKTEKHLPGIPSAQQVAAHGISLGDMQAKLLAKIEELTLHQIEQEKRIQKLEEENRKLCGIQ